MAWQELDRGGTWHYVERGDGASTILLLHCSAGSSSQWSTLVEELAVSHRVIAPDLYGYGRSASWSGPEKFTLARETEVLTRILRTRPHPVHLVAHSYGGAVAMRLALERRIPLASVALIEPVAFHLLRQDAAAGRRHLEDIESVARFVRGAVTRRDYLSAMAGFVDFWNGAGSWDRMRAETRYALATRAPKLPHDFAACIGESWRLRDFRALNLPTLLLRGQHAPAPTRRIVELLAATLPQARAEVIDGAGHMAPLTHSREVNALVSAHVTANTAPAYREAV